MFSPFAGSCSSFFVFFLGEDQAEDHGYNSGTGYTAEQAGSPEGQRNQRIRCCAEANANCKRDGNNGSGSGCEGTAVMDNIHAGNQNGTEGGKGYAAQNSGWNAGEYSAQLGAKTAESYHAAGDGGNKAAGNTGKTTQTDIGAAADDRNHIEHRGNDAADPLSQYTALGFMAGGQAVLRQHGGGGLIAHQLNQCDEAQNGDGDDRPQFKFDAEMQGLRNANPRFLGNGGKIQLAKSSSSGAHDQNGDEGRSLGKEVLAAEVVEQNHDNDGAGSQQQVNGIAVISGAYTACTVADTDAAKAEPQRHNDCAGDVGLEQNGELLMQTGPKNGGDDAADEAGTSERSQTILGAQGNAGGYEYKAALQRNGQPRTDGADADGLQQGGNTGNEQAAGDQNGDLASGETDAGADEQRNGQNIKNENNNLLDTQWDGFLDGRAVIQTVADGDL